MALMHTNFGGLIKKLLKSLDSYNADDLTISTPSVDQDTLGERAGIAINLALHQIYDLIKGSKYTEAYPSTSLSSEINKDYISLDPESYLDDIEAVTDTENDLSLIQKSWAWYRRNFSDPSGTPGTPEFYIRRGNRLYLAPRPSAIINYTIDFQKLTDDLILNGDLPLLPTHYDYWILAEAKVQWFEMEDPSAVPALVISERNEKRQTAIDSIFSNFGRIMQSKSNTENENTGVMPFESPAT